MAVGSNSHVQMYKEYQIQENPPQETMADHSLYAHQDWMQVEEIKALLTISCILNESWKS